MMQSKERITRENAMDIIHRFAKEYRKVLGKTPGEVIIVGGGSIMLNYGFRDSTQDLDVIIHAASGIRDVIHQFAEENGLPRDWMNTDFTKTASFSEKLTEVSQHFCWLNNQTLEIRTVSGVYLIAMKMRARRNYRNDISDAIGILIEEQETGNRIAYDELEKAYRKLYQELPNSETRGQFRKICSKSIDELKNIYDSQKETEKTVGKKLVNYIEHGADINTENVEDVVARIKEKLNRQ